MANKNWNDELKQWAGKARGHEHRDRAPAIVVIGGHDAGHSHVVLLDEVGEVRVLDIDRAELPDLAREVATGAFGRVDLVALGIAPLPPPPPPPGPIGDDTIYAAKLNAVAAIRVLVQLTELRVAFDRARNV
jgi:hypothetical protein